MRTCTTILFLVLLSLNSSGQGDLFPGLVGLKIGTHRIYTPPDSTNRAIVSVKFGYKGEDLSKFKSDTVKFKFYADQKAKNLTRQISFYFDWSTIPRIERIVEQDYHSWFSPMCFNDDTISGYFEIYLTCKSRQGDWFEVIINEQTQETLWLRKAKFVNLIKWKDLHKNEDLLTLQLNKTPTNKIYDKPDTSSTEISYSGQDCFEIIRIKGQWMQIANKNSELCGNYDTAFVDNAWVQYKTSDRLLINLKKE
jgi:hypothetical protein